MLKTAFCHILTGFGKELFYYRKITERKEKTMFDDLFAENNNPKTNTQEQDDIFNSTPSPTSVNSYQEQNNNYAPSRNVYIPHRKTQQAKNTYTQNNQQMFSDIQSPAAPQPSYSTSSPVENMGSMANNMPRGTIGDYKKYARADIDWKTLVIPTVLCMVIAYVMSELEGLAMNVLGGVVGSVLSLIISIGMLVLIAGLTAGLYNVYLEQKRNKQKASLFGKFNRTLPMLGLGLLLALIYSVPMGITCIPIFYGYLNKNNALIGIGFLLFLIWLGFCVYFSLKWSQAEILCTEGAGPIESMKKSSQLMKHHKMQFLGLCLSFLGWVLLGALFGTFINLLLGTLPFHFMSEVSTLGVVLVGKNNGIAVVAALIPVLVYFTMTKIEFYEDLVGNGVNPITKTASKSAIWVTAVAVLIISLFSAIGLMLPINRVSSNNAVAEWNGSLYTAGPGSISVKPIKFATLPVDTPIETPLDNPTENPIEAPIDNPIDTPSTPDVSGNQQSALGLKYTVPSGYELFSSTEDSISYFSGSESIWIDRYESDEDLSYLVDTYGATQTTVGGEPAYCYQSFDNYYYVFKHNGYRYDINGFIESDVNTLVQSINFEG